MFWIFQVIMLATFVIIINQYQNRQYQNGDKLTDHVHSFVASAHCRCHQCTSPVKIIMVIIIITDIAIIIIITAILFVIIVFVVTFFH